VTHRTLLAPARACLFTAALLAVATAPAKGPQDAKKDTPDKGTAAEPDERYRREAERVVGGIEVQVLGDDKWAEVERIEKPLLYYGDATRENDRGSVWGWGRTGRPVAVMELYQNTAYRTRWVYAICNTSGKKLRARRGGEPWWGENDSASELKDVPAAPAPPTDPAQRQRQLKLLAQKFTGHQFWDPDNSRYELRRLDRPLHTYRDEAGGVLDGSLYTLANGTNPEILLFVEARADPESGGKAVWRYAVGRLAHAELHMEYDGKEVFNAPRGNRVSGRDKPYWLGFINTAPDPGPEK